MHDGRSASFAFFGQAHQAPMAMGQDEDWVEETFSNVWRVLEQKTMAVMEEHGEEHGGQNGDDNDNVNNGTNEK